jgi:GxxExxY protein
MREGFLFLMTLSHPESVSISKRIIGAGMEVHSYFGPGLLESAYVESFCFEMTDSGLYVEQQRLIPLRYKSHPMHTSYRADLIVEGLVLVEVKAIEKVIPIHCSQALTYMRLTNLKVGLIINFNVRRLSEGITRLSL